MAGSAQPLPWRKAVDASEPLVLIVEDMASLAQTYSAILKKHGFAVHCVDTGEKALAHLAKRSCDALLLDVNLPDMTGLDVLDRLRARGDTTEAVVVTADGSISLAVDAMRRGASDFIVKPLNAHRLVVTITNAAEKARLKAEVKSLRQELVSENGFCRFIGHSPVMQTVYRIIRNAAPSNATVFITGESGTGKELCADAIHRSSKRATGPLVTLNCAAIPKDLLESEIFGHVKGAFSGATADRKGAALAANGGTLFLDEICEMDFNLQAKLLRFLQSKEVQRLGEDMVSYSDARIVCASNRDPMAEVKAGRFREDLYYRLHVIPIDLPPLRGREDDVLSIARHFLRQFSAEEGKSFEEFSEDAAAALLAYDWPGNVRQLQNTIRGIVVLNDGNHVALDTIPIDIRSAAASARPLPTPASATLAIPDVLATDAAEAPVIPLDSTIRTAITQAIAAFGGSVPKAAAALDVSPSTLYRRLEAWNTP